MENTKKQETDQSSPKLSANENTTQAARIESLRELLGPDVILLPISAGTKYPVICGWQKTDVSEMENPCYLRDLSESGNTGVLLGDPSGGLCTIDIDSDDEVEPFLALNPRLRTTLRSKGARGEQLWVRMTSPYPAPIKFVTEAGNAWGEWRSTGNQSVIQGTHPSGNQYSFVHRAPPIEISFEDIHWPSHLKLPWVKSDFDLLTEDAGEPFSISERGTVTLNQKFFVEAFMLENRVVFDSSLGEFFLYHPDSGIWNIATVETIKRKFLERIGEVAKDSGLPSLHYRCNDHTASSLTNQLRFMAEKPGVFHNRPPAIHVKNGMICFEGDDVELRGFHPDFYSRNVCPYEYAPEAQCPQFLNELLGPALNEEDISLIQRWAGAVLMGRNDAQRMLLLLGTPGGGKSTLMTILESVIGTNNVAQLRTEQLSKPFELYAFNGKTLLSGKDVAADFMSLKSASVVKALIGGDLLEAEKKGFNNRVQIRGNFNVGITCNADLNVRLEGDVGAWFRRLLAVKYDRPPVERKIVGYAEKLLKEEGPGILRWMVEGAIKLQRELRDHGDYILTQTQLARVDLLLQQSDSVKAFVRDGIVKNPSCTLTVKYLQQGYYTYCEQQGMQPMNPKDVNAQLPRYMMEIHQAALRHDIPVGSGTQRGYKGIRLKTEVCNED
ncbi:P4 family phage/plasmid primase-like protein [Roseimicrobium gellanilyticum]|uniref:P4 family phage/plasmid primase-like protein n=1 Tax=Roseimicrobium gellanilyticum TaxID=748857 RepID=A0A366HG32_9BACT|nr:phage/plasmid primase, P4 family [Roseimicrobium gellanilyticum]RBP41468.1 P4 family phage/plasmid primase-like protein [Roseimicrobium gellanilyticum]